MGDPANPTLPDDEIKILPTENDEKTNREQANRVHDAQWALETEFNQYAQECATAAIKSFLLINGGSAVAMLGFLATASSEGSKITIDIGPAVCALVSFAMGVMLAGLCAGLSYLFVNTHVAAMHEVERHSSAPYLRTTSKHQGKYDRAELFGQLLVVLGALSLVAFVFGVLQVAGSFEANASKVEIQPTDHTP
ncbi:MAG: hypothetical protein AB3N07_08240 [Ruegeria sp.]